MFGSTTKKFNAYRGLNSCPVCTSRTGKCSWQEYELSAHNGRITPTTKIFCMGGAGGYGHPDFHYFADTRDGQWGVYVPLNDWSVHRGENYQASVAERERWYSEQQAKQAALLAAENQRRAESLGATERNLAARNILDRLILHEVDRQDLIKRGFTPTQIKSIGFKSVEKWQRLPEPVNNRFPGVNISGTKLNNSIAGILIPLYTVTGAIVGCQIRNREKSTSRYRWLSSSWEKGRDNGASPALQNGENPLTFVYPQLYGVELERQSVGLAEGTGAKPHLAAIKLGQQVIGAAGGQWLSSPELLRDGLRRWRAEVIDLYLDGDDLQKPSVMRRWLKLHHQLTEWGYQPRFLYSGKDIDELTDLSCLQELSVTGLERILKETTPQPAVISLARKLYQKSKQFTANHTQTNRYLEWDVSKEDLNNALIAIKSPLGTGKTEVLKDLAVRAKTQGLELNFLGYRNNLLRQTCDRVPDLYHVVDEDKIFLASDYHKALCHHSAGLLDPSEMGNKILVIDECVSALIDMLTSKLTAGRRQDGRDSRQVRLAHILELLESCHAVVVLDGYLSDTEVDFLQNLRQFDRVRKIENTFKNQMNVRLVNAKSTLTRAVIDDALAGSNLLITATSQKQCENLEKALVKVGIPEPKICRIDSTTDRDESILLFFKNPKAYLERYRPQVVILSPTAESGISIDLSGYFQTHYHFHLGNLGILSGLQFLGRYRDFSSPRVIYCADKGQIDPSNSSSFTKSIKDEFDRRVGENLDLVLALIERGQNKEAIALLNDYAQQEDIWLKLAHQYRANLNEEMKHLKELFVEAMVADGYTVTIDPENLDGCDDTSDLMGKVETERRVIQSRRIYDALDIDKLEYEAIRTNPAASELDRLLASKYHLTQQQLPGIMATASYSPELIQMVKYNHPALIQQLEHYFYLLHPELARINHLATWLPAEELVWLPDRIQRSSLPLINVGRELGLDNLVGKSVTVEQIEEIIDRITTTPTYQSSLQIKVNPHQPPEPIKLFRRVVKKFGCKLAKSADGFILTPLADGVLSFRGAPRYELLTPELVTEVMALAGKEYRTDDPRIQILGARMEALGMYDGRGKMRLVAGSARYLGLAVTSHRHRTIDREGNKKVTRVYKFGINPDAISGAIGNTQLYPNTQPIYLKHVFECVTTRLERLAREQNVRLKDIQGVNIEVLQEFETAIHIDRPHDINEINEPETRSGSSELSTEDIRSVAQTLVEVDRMEEWERQIVWDGYLSTIDREVVCAALELLRAEQPDVVVRSSLYFQ